MGGEGFDDRLGKGGDSDEFYGLDVRTESTILKGFFLVVLYSI
jgi:hypothetical protein